MFSLVEYQSSDLSHGFFAYFTTNDLMEKYLQPRR